MNATKTTAFWDGSGTGNPPHKWEAESRVPYWGGGHRARFLAASGSAMSASALRRSTSGIVSSGARCALERPVPASVASAASIHRVVRAQVHEEYLVTVPANEDPQVVFHAEYRVGGELALRLVCSKERVLPARGRPPGGAR